MGFYTEFGEAPTQQALAQLLSDLVVIQTLDVAAALDRQRFALLAVAGLFAITAVYSTLLLV
jgi:hypothetical protein